jgi:ParB family transcriptional regulator, chromosome partitioning protein
LKKAYLEKDISSVCADCPTRSIHNIDLFGDAKKNDFCLNPVCYRAKTQAAIADKIREYEDDGKKLYLISSKSYGNVEGVVYYQDYNNLSRETGIKGIYVDGINIGKIVNIEFCGKMASKNKKSSGEKREPPYEERLTRWNRKMELHNNRIEIETRTRLIKPILSAITKVTKEDLKLIAIWVRLEMVMNYEEVFTEALGLPKDFFSGWDNDAEKAIKSLNEHQLVRLLLAIAISKEEMSNDPQYVPGDEMLSDLVKRYKIDRAGITKTVTAEMKSKEPRKPEKPEPVKAEKKPAKKTVKKASKKK